MISFKKHLKGMKSSLGELWNTASVYYSFYKRHRNIYNNGSFLVDTLTKPEKKEYLNYWKKITPLISTKTVEISKSLSGEYNKYIVPEEVYALKIENYLIPRKSVAFIENKSFYEKWFGEGVFPKTYFHKIDNTYYDSELTPISNIDNFIISCDIVFPVVFKPSVDSYGGADVFFVENEEELLKLNNRFENIVCQEKIIQSQLINKIYEDSINTVRVCLYKNKNEFFKVINASLRMGKDGSLDNATAGGIVCSISETGVFNDYAVDKLGLKYNKHPNNDFVFSGETLPFYDEMVNVSENIANKIFQTRLVSLDMCLDENNEWRCIEVNLLGQTIRFAQYAGKPFFGKFTDSLYDEIVSAIDVR